MTHIAPWSVPKPCQLHILARAHVALRPLSHQIRRNALRQQEATTPDHARCKAWRCAAASDVGAVEAPRHLKPGKPQLPKGWQEVLDMQAEGTTWRGEIQSVNKGGVVLDVNGLRGFIPLSRLSPDRLQALDRQENQTGQPIAAKIIQNAISSEYLQKSGVLVQVNIPERQLILSEQATMVEELAASLNQGDVVEGIVTRVVDYGAFVSLRSPDGGMHGAVGLIHISELAWSRVTNPETVVQPGSLVKCKVINVDREKGKIGLSLKQMEGDPLLENLDDLLPINDSTVPVVPANLPSAVEEICKALMEEEQIDAVDIGRQVEEKRAVSQDLELWISKESVQDGYNVVVRTGRLVQEIHVTTQLPGQSMKQAVQRVLRKLV